MMLGWYAAYVKANSEFSFERRMATLGVECYVPSGRLRRRLRYKRALLERDVPVFPSYVFLQTDTVVERWREVFDASEFYFMIGFDGEPLVIDDSSIQRLKQRQENGEFDDRIPRSVRVLKVGAVVRFVNSAFDHLEGVVLRIKNHDARRILVGVGGMPVEVPLSKIKILG